MGGVELRPYQTESVQRFYSLVDAGTMTRGLCVQATGCGKTVTMGKAIHTQRRRQKAAGDTRPMVFLAHRTELIHQAYNQFRSLMPYLDIQIEQGTQKASPSADLVVASIQTLGRGRLTGKGSPRLPWLEDRGLASLLLVDEVHHGASSIYMDVAERCGAFNGNTLVWGTTATPQRMEKKSICRSDGSSLLEHEFYNYGLIPAIKDGWLCPIKGYLVVTETDLSHVRIKGGDFDPSALSDAVDNDERTEVAFRHWKELASDRLTIGFCVSVSHARHSCEYWQRQGVKSEYIYGEMPMDERRRILSDFRCGRVRVLFGCEILTEGYDCPPVSCILMLRPTRSGSLYAQCIGRGTRKFAGDEYHGSKHDCLILDVTDNSTKHRLDERGTRDGVQSLSAAIGLPEGIDLEGEDVLSVKAAWDEAEEGGTDTSKVRSLSGLRTAAKVIDLLDEASVPAEVDRHSTLAWGKVGNGYIITAPPRFSGDEQRLARLYQDTLGEWQLCIDKQAPKIIAGDQKGFPEFPSADTALLSAWPDAKYVLAKKSAWRQKPPSEGQIKLLKRLGMKEHELTNIDMGKAGMLIDKLKKGGVRAMWGAARRR